jgi:hypothetical protein
MLLDCNRRFRHGCGKVSALIWTGLIWLTIVNAGCAGPAHKKICGPAVEGQGGPPGGPAPRPGAWSVESSPTNQNLFGVWGTGPNDVFAAGDHVILHYDGSGRSVMNGGSTTPMMSNPWGTASNNVFVPGAFGAIWHYDGSTWSPMKSGTAQNLLAMWGAAPDAVFAVGDGGTILHYVGQPEKRGRQSPHLSRDR